jgi:PAS domain S-box-containing protein
MWLLPALIAVITTSFILSLTFFYLWQRERLKSLIIIAFGWLLYTLRFVCMLVMTKSPLSFLFLSNQLINIWSSWLLYSGCIYWLNRKLSKILLLLVCLVTAWITVCLAAGLDTLAYTIPVFALSGYLFVELGIRFLDCRQIQETAIKILGWTLIFWGVHKLDYPLLRPVAAFAPWGYLLSSVFQIITAIAMVLVYFERTKLMLLENKGALGKQKLFYENILESIESGIWVADKNDKIIYANNGVELITGIPSSGLIGVSFENDLSQYQLEDFRKYYMKARNSLKEVAYQTRVITGRGDEAFLSGMLFPIFDGGQYNGMICTLLDLTDRIILEQQLRDTLEEREVLIREIHHRIKNNLSVVLGLISYEGTKSSDTKIKVILDELSSKIYSISLIHSILYNSDNFTYINIRSYLNELLRYLTEYYNCSKHLIDFQLNLENEQLDLDRSKTVGLIVNELVTNSLKYAFPQNDHTNENNRIIVEIGQQGDDIFLKVSDNGVGYKCKEKLDGNGHSGLFLVRTLCSELDADFRIENDNGTTAVISFKKNND